MEVELNGEVFNLDSVDESLDALAAIDSALSELHDLRRRVQIRLVSEVEDNPARTLRVIGKRRLAVITRPSPTWQQAPLKTAWGMYPEHAKKLLRIDRLTPQAVELKKLENAVVKQKTLADCLALVLGARTTPATLPSVKVESL